MRFSSRYIFEFPDAVRVVRLLARNRPFDGAPNIARPPALGDIGTVVGVTRDRRFHVEAVDSAGLTVWLAEFEASELELVLGH